MNKKVKIHVDFFFYVLRDSCLSATFCLLERILRSHQRLNKMKTFHLSRKLNEKRNHRKLHERSRLRRKEHKLKSCGKFVFCRVLDNACAASLIGKANERGRTRLNTFTDFPWTFACLKRTFIVFFSKCVLFLFVYHNWKKPLY